MDADTRVPLRSVDRSSAISSPEITFELLPSLGQLVALKDIATHAHLERVGQLAHDWAKTMQAKSKWTEVEVHEFEIAARLHDLGKVGVLDEVLHKTSALSPEERAWIELHSEIGYQMIRDYPGARAIADGVRHHHERWDGRGYPMGLKENRIPWLSRAIAIIDAFDAMTSPRVYRAPWSELEALHEIKLEAGRQFDPQLVEDFAEFFYSRRT